MNTRKGTHPRSVEVRRAIDQLVDLAIGLNGKGSVADPATKADQSRRHLIEEMVATALRLYGDEINVGELRLMRQSLREMRAGFTMFGKYRSLRKIAVFGSARTPTDHADYKAAVEFTRLLSQRKWMTITGAGPGIMQAGIEGPTPEWAFGLCIRLPFEERPNPLIAGDPKLLPFRYFFTRKLAFMGNADAVAAFPGGLGTQDELFEALTLVQCGRNSVIPIVLIEGTDEHGAPLGYWRNWQNFVQSSMFDNGWVSREDEDLYDIVASPEEAVEIVTGFYRRYQSSRYVDDLLVLRLDSPLGRDACAELTREFSGLLVSGVIEEGRSLDGDDAPDGTPRLWFRHNRKHFGLVRRMIDRINAIPHEASHA
ncbi:MAG: LOG family protein [Phycisphaerales bacterium]|nr:LOG family protein [Phycisphaerales bacterium]